METGWISLENEKQSCRYDPAVPLLGIHLDKTTIRKDPCIPRVHSSTVPKSQGTGTTSMSIDRWTERLSWRPPLGCELCPASPETLPGTTPITPDLGDEGRGTELSGLRLELARRWAPTSSTSCRCAEAAGVETQPSRGASPLEHQAAALQKHRALGEGPSPSRRPGCKYHNVGQTGPNWLLRIQRWKLNLIYRITQKLIFLKKVNILGNGYAS